MRQNTYRCGDAHSRLTGEQHAILLFPAASAGVRTTLYSGEPQSPHALRASAVRDGTAWALYWEAKTLVDIAKNVVARSASDLENIVSKLIDGGW